MGETPEGAMLPLSTLQSFLDEIDGFDACHTPLYTSHRHEQDAPTPLAVKPLLKARRKKRKETGAPPLAPTNTKEGHSQRVKQLLRHIHALRLQLKLQHVGHEQELLDPNSARTDSTQRDWKRQAILEDCMKTQSMDENKLMRKRLRDGAKLGQSMRKLMLKQIDVIRQLEALARPVSPLGIALADEDTHMFASIKSSMDARMFNIDSNMNKRLLEITQQCIEGRPVGDGQWRVTTSSQAVFLSFESSGLVLFNAEAINAVICDRVRLNVPEQIADKIYAKHVEFSLAVASGRRGGIEVGSRSVLRRVRSDYGVVLMWESISTWQNAADAVEGEPKRVLVCDSGWSIVTQVTGYSKDTSIGHCQKVLRIQSMDELPLKQEDKLVASIVRQSQRSFTAQGQSMENALVDKTLGDRGGESDEIQER